MAAPDRYKPSNGPVIPYKAAAGASWKAGDIVLQLATGYATVGGDTASCDGFIGIAAEDCDNTNGSAGDLSVNVDVGGAYVQCTHTAGSLAITNQGLTVYVDGANACDSYAGVTNKNAMGKVQSVVSATEVWVKCFTPDVAVIHAGMSALAASASTNPSEAQYNAFLAIWH